MQTYKDMVGEAKSLHDQAQAILTNPSAGAEERAKIEPLLKSADEVMGRAAQLKEIEAKRRELSAQTEPAPEPENPAGFDGMGDFLKSVWLTLNPAYKFHDPRLVAFKDEREGGMERKDSKTMTENVGAAGGFLVPLEQRTEVMGFMSENTIARSRATIIPMARRQVSLPVLDQTGTTAGIPHWFGGMKFYWGEESAEKTVTDAAFRQVTLTANKLYGYTRASDELVEDSAISLSAFLGGPMGFSGGIAWMEDYAFLQGTGVGQPLGILNAGATLTVARNQDSPAFTFDDAADMRRAFLPTGRGVWVINQSLMDEVITMNGPSANPSYVWQPNARDGIPGMLLGFPVIWTEKTPVAGSAGDVMLIDWSYYLIGDRQATTIESTKYDYWRYDQTSWRAVHRVDGQPWLSTPLTLQDGSTQISPFVILGTKSS
jgi:HK97 family phage major capsid protein